MAAASDQSLAHLRGQGQPTDPPALPASELMAPGLAAGPEAVASAAAAGQGVAVRGLAAVEVAASAGDADREAARVDLAGDAALKI